MSTSEHTQTNGSDNQTHTDDPAPTRKRRLDLTTLAHVRKEMCAVYRSMKLKRIQSQDGTRLTYVLQAIAKVIEGSELANRIEQLEKALQAQRH
jgi:hypothetical protein